MDARLIRCEEETLMAETGKMLKFACGCVAVVMTGEVWVIGYHEGCSTLQRLCEMHGLPPDNPHTPENDQQPSNTKVRTVIVEASASDTGMSAIAHGLDMRALGKLTDT
jgi:hypothetical protein